MQFYAKKKENHNEQYCNCNVFYSWELIQITLICEGMRTYNSVNVLFLNFSDLKSITKTFNV